jgi:hypothetical protein
MLAGHSSDNAHLVECCEKYSRNEQGHDIEPLSHCPTAETLPLPRALFLTMDSLPSAHILTIDSLSDLDVRGVGSLTMDSLPGLEVRGGVSLTLDSLPDFGPDPERPDVESMGKAKPSGSEETDLHASELNIVVKEVPEMNEWRQRPQNRRPASARERRATSAGSFRSQQEPHRVLCFRRSPCF